MKVCPVCKEKYDENLVAVTPDGDEFCPNCGHNEMMDE